MPHPAHHGVQGARERVGAGAGHGRVLVRPDHFRFFRFLERVALAGRAGRVGPFGRAGGGASVPVAEASTGARSAGASWGSGASSASGASCGLRGLLRLRGLERLGRLGGLVLRGHRLGGLLGRLLPTAVAGRLGRGVARPPAPPLARGRPGRGDGLLGDGRLLGGRVVARCPVGQGDRARGLRLRRGARALLGRCRLDIRGIGEVEADAVSHHQLLARGPEVRRHPVDDQARRDRELEDEEARPPSGRNLMSRRWEAGMFGVAESSVEQELGAGRRSPRGRTRPSRSP